VKPPKISIALATYNGAAFLDEQLRTLAEQTVRPHELVVADDGSTDNTLAIIEAFAEAAPFAVRILEVSKRLGYRLNFRRAATACTGDLIAFCDQDDIWSPRKLEVVARAFDDPEVLLVYHNATVFDGATTRPLHLSEIELPSLASPAPLKTVNGLLQTFRADLRRFDDLWDRSIDHNEGRVILAHDQWYLFLAMFLGKVRFIDQSLLNYRQHTNNVFGVKSRETAISRFLLKFSHFGDQDVWAAAGAERRSEIIAAVGQREGRADLMQTAQEFGQLASRLHRRAQTYFGNSWMQRMAALGRAMRAQDYAGTKWSFNKKALIRDFWKGVALGLRHDPTRASPSRDVTELQ